jgi:hypothetical protein
MKAFIAKIVAAYKAAVNFTATQYLKLVNKHVEVAKAIGELDSVKKQIGAALLFITVFVLEIVVVYYAAFMLMFVAMLAMMLVFNVWVSIIAVSVATMWFVSDVLGTACATELKSTFKSAAAAA